MNCKLNTGIDVLWKIRKFVHEKTLKVCARKNLGYSTLVWSGHTQKKLTKHWIDSLEPLCLNRNMTLIKSFYKYLGILPLKQNIKLQQGKFIHSLPDCSWNKFSLIHHQAINANQQKLITPYYRTTTGKRPVLYQGYKLWNSEISVSAKLRETIEGFSKQFQADLLGSI